MALVSELTTIVTANTSDFRKKINQASNDADNFGSRIAKAGVIGAGVIGVTLVAAFGALLHVVNQTTEQIDELVNTSQKLGTTVAAVQKLQYAANLADVSTGSLDASMKRLVGTLNNLESGNKKTIEAFKAIGLTAKDLQGLSLDQAFTKISAEIAKLPTALDQAKVGTVIFGRGFQNISNLVRSDIKAAGEEFAAFGGVISEEGAAGVSAYDDAMKKLSAVLDIFKMQLTVAVAPALQSITEFITKQIVEWGGLGNIAKATAVFMVDGLIGVATGIEAAIDGVNSLIKAYERLKLILLETRQVFNDFNFAVTGGDIDFSRLSEIAKLKRDINAPTSNPATSLVGGLGAIKNQISSGNKASTEKSKLDITVKTTEGFLLSIAGSPEFTKAIQQGSAGLVSKEASAVGS